MFVRAVVPASVTLVSFSELTHSLGLAVRTRQRAGLSLCSGKVSCVAANLSCRFIVRDWAAACQSDTQHGAKSCALPQASLLSNNRGIVLG